MPSVVVEGIVTSMLKVSPVNGTFGNVPKIAESSEAVRLYDGLGPLIFSPIIRREEPALTWVKGLPIC